MMKHKWVGILLVCVFMMMAAAPVPAHDYDRNDSDYWLRICAYALHPFGIALEYGVTRPIHWLVSRPDLCIIFGHDPGPEDEYFVWK